jgi:hypothetical protein
MEADDIKTPLIANGLSGKAGSVYFLAVCLFDGQANPESAYRSPGSSSWGEGRHVRQPLATAHQWAHNLYEK